MNTEKPTPDYGEPWTPAFRNSARTANGHDHGFMDGFRDRAIACVNACAGMPDPAAEIEAMREAMKAAYEALISFGDHTHQKHICSPTECFCRVGKLKTALAKLQPFVKP